MPSQLKLLLYFLAITVTYGHRPPHGRPEGHPEGHPESHPEGPPPWGHSDGWDWITPGSLPPSRPEPTYRPKPEPTRPEPTRPTRPDTTTPTSTRPTSTRPTTTRPTSTSQSPTSTSTTSTPSSSSRPPTTSTTVTPSTTTRRSTTTRSPTTTPTTTPRPTTPTPTPGECDACFCNCNCSDPVSNPALRPQQRACPACDTSLPNSNLPGLPYQSNNSTNSKCSERLLAAASSYRDIGSILGEIVNQLLSNLVSILALVLTGNNTVQGSVLPLTEVLCYILGLVLLLLQNIGALGVLGPKGLLVKILSGLAMG